MESRSLDPTPELLLEHASWATALARRLVGESAAEDLVQETWLAALQSPPRNDRPLRPWLGTVLGNFARKRSRGRGRRRAREERGARDEALPSAAELTEKAESQKLLVEALLELDESLREVLLLRFFEELSAAEIARRQGIPASTVKSRLERGLEALRVRLDDRFEGGRRAWSLALLPLLRPSPGVVETSVGLSASLTGVLGMKMLFKLVFWSLFVLIGAVVLTGVGFLALSSFESIPRETVAFTPLVLEEEERAGETPAPAEQPRREAIATRARAETPETGPALVHIEARFVDIHGRPVGGVVLTRRSSGRGELGRSGADGRVAVERRALDHVDDVQLYFQHPWYASDGISFELAPGRGIDLGDLVLREGGALSGRVLDGVGNPLVGADVDVRGEMVARPSAGGMTTYTSTDLGAAHAVTDAEGRFRLGGLLAGDVRVEVEAEEGLHRHETGWVEIRPGQESTGLTIVVPRTPADERIEGVVLDPEGRPVPHCAVQASYSTFLGGGSLGEVTDDDGRFRFVVHADTDHELVARRKGWDPVIRQDVEPGDLGVELRFRESLTFSLEVVDERGKPVGEFACGVMDGSGEHSLQWSPASEREEGRATLRVPAVPFTVEVLAPGFAEVSAGPFQPGYFDREGEVVSVSLRSLPGITGRVVAGGEPVAGAEVYLQRLAGGRVFHDGFPVRFSSRSVEEARSDEAGRFRLDLREEDEYVVRVEAEGLAATELGPFELDPDVGYRDLECVLSPGGSIQGRVVRAPGRSPAGTIVAISRGDCWARTQRVDADGLFHFEHLIPGPWQVVRVDEEIGEGHFTSKDGFFSSAFDEVPSNCTVVEGRETRFDLIETSVPICTLEGRLDFGGLDLSSWRASLLGTDEPAGPIRRSPAEDRLERDGSFRIVVSGEGPRQLLVTAPEELRLSFVAVVDLIEGQNRWEASFEPATLTISNPRQRFDAIHWPERGGVSAFALLVSESGGPLTLDPVPAGSARIAAPDPEAPSADPAEWRTLLEVELQAGEETVVELP